MTDTGKLNQLIVESCYGMPEVAYHTGLSPAGFFARMNNWTDFTEQQIDCVCRLLRIKNPSRVFFAQNIDVLSIRRVV